MFSTVRSRAVCQLSRRAHVAARRAYAFSANDKQEINDPNPPKEVPNVSKTNELPQEIPNRSKPLQEFAAKAEELRVQQSPNRLGVWSRSQNPRSKAMSGPRFEQTIMELQVCCGAAWVLSDLADPGILFNYMTLLILQPASSPSRD